VFKYLDMSVAELAPNVHRRQAYSENLMACLFELTNGPGVSVPLHHHPHEQISCVVEGRLKFVIGEGEDETVDVLEAGDMAVIPPNAPHTVELLSESARVIDCFHPIREDFL
jgi:quercetin dioxygenase-like cupin family protein